jgi:hypothetical protein
MKTDTQVSPKRQSVATALGVITLLCAILFYLSFGFVMLQWAGGAYAGAALPFIVLVFTLPPAIICTIISLFLVGPRRCKLAWISLCLYPLFFTFAFIVAICAPHQ